MQGTDTFFDMSKTLTKFFSVPKVSLLKNLLDHLKIGLWMLNGYMKIMTMLFQQK